MDGLSNGSIITSPLSPKPRDGKVPLWIAAKKVRTKLQFKGLLNLWYFRYISAYIGIIQNITEAETEIFEKFYTAKNKLGKLSSPVSVAGAKMDLSCWLHNAAWRINDTEYALRRTLCSMLSFARCQCCYQADYLQIRLGLLKIDIFH